jgi:O-methyltransferase involved in polyketide biosynthesis
MKPGRGSQTAVLVCAARAVAHEAGWTPAFSDPTAMALLPEAGRARARRFLDGPPPKGAREAWAHGHLDRLAKMMTVRTVTIDEAVREARAPQLVILGAGLDGRAWRMPELAEVDVFEVDHPDSQRDKRGRVEAREPAREPGATDARGPGAGALTSTARSVRFVAVDFASADHDLDAALAAAGHDPRRPTTWIWEGVVMYLTPAEVAATLAVVQRRSAPGSRLVVLYHAPGFMLKIVGLLVRRLGEPLRSVFTPAQMRELLARHGFTVLRDDALPDLARAVAPKIADALRFMHHTRIAVVQREGRG